MHTIGVSIGKEEKGVAEKKFFRSNGPKFSQCDYNYKCVGLICIKKLRKRYLGTSKSHCSKSVSGRKSSLKQGGKKLFH